MIKERKAEFAYTDNDIWAKISELIQEVNRLSKILGPIDPTEKAEGGNPALVEANRLAHEDLYFPPPRDKTYDFSGAKRGAVLKSAEPAYKQHWTEFVEEMEARLAQGYKEYGDASFGRDPSELKQEIEEEILDWAVWSYILWTRVRKLELNKTT
jgi:hypothetical protein